jgi:metal-responsive CopG/Arc/MetJ family transcriptional regulator
MSAAEKVAITLPAALHERLERTRLRLKLNRSEAVQQAVGLWLRAQEGDPRIEQYLRGYRAQPDDPQEASALAEAWAVGLAEEDWE